MKKIIVVLAAFMVMGITAAFAQRASTRLAMTVATTTGSVGSPGRGSVHRDGIPRAPRGPAATFRALAIALRYRGTTAVPNPKLGYGDLQASVCDRLAKSDFVPPQRVQRFAMLDREKYAVVRWHLAVEGLTVQPDHSLVRVRVSPGLKTTGGTSATCVNSYSEEYLVAGGTVQFVRAEPPPPDMQIGVITD